MVAIYVRKITNGEINPKTGEAWAINDVPMLWREKVRKELESQAQVQTQETETTE
jgi:hypothetical protein